MSLAPIDHAIGKRLGWRTTTQTLD